MILKVMFLKGRLRCLNLGNGWGVVRGVYASFAVGIGSRFFGSTVPQK